MPTISRRLIAILAAAAFTVALVAGRLTGPRAAPDHPASALAAPTATASTLATPPDSTLVVHVVGAVRHPGVYTLTAGARAIDAVRAAGGVRGRAQLDGVNLAAPLSDGEQVIVPARGAPAAARTTARPGPVHLNAADAAALDALPGVGPATAERIVSWRAEHGPFRAIDDLLEVPGIGPAKLAAMRSRLAL